ncbi:MAG: radical SAM protein [Myxococcales bacterium]|nr:radical SAM protein [Myxococcales bacterium]
MELAALRPVRASGLYEGLVEGRRFVHNPRGFDALAVLSQRAGRLLDSCDGRPLGELAAALDAPVSALEPELRLLGANGFVTGEGVTPARRPAPGPRRFDLWVHVTNACNLDCPYCYIEKDAAHLNESVATTLQRAILHSIETRGLKAFHLRFAGGEPLLRFEFIRTFFEDTRRKVEALGATLSAAILTNGTRVDDAIARWCRESRVSVSVSIDGVGVTQDAMRPRVGGGGSFALVEAGLDTLARHGVAPYALVTVGDTNLAALPALTRYLVDRGLGFRYSLVRDLEGRGALLDARSTGWRVDPRLVTLRRKTAPREAEGGILGGAALDRVLSVFSECYDLIEAAVPRAGLSFRQTHRFCDLEWRRPIAKACAAGEGSLAVGHDGQLSLCQAALHTEGTKALAPDAALDAVAPTVTHLANFRRAAPNDECSGCRFRSSCAGGCPLLLHRRDGHVNGRSPYCEVFRYVLPRILRIAARELIVTPRR